MPEWMEQTPWWVFVSLAVVVGGLVVRVAVWLGRVDTRLTAVEKRLDTIAKSLKEGLAEVRGDVKDILTRMGGPPAAQSNSPISLTEFGKKISATVAAKLWSVEHAPHLVSDAKGKAEFEIYDLCVAHVNQQFEHDEDLQRRVRAGAYDLGTQQAEVLRVYAVELRDEVLRQISPGE